jgi:hypothetical protein
MFITFLLLATYLALGVVITLAAAKTKLTTFTLPATYAFGILIAPAVAAASLLGLALIVVVLPLGVLTKRWAERRQVPPETIDDLGAYFDYSKANDISVKPPNPLLYQIVSKSKARHDN